MSAKNLWEYDHPYYANEGCYWVGGLDFHRVHAEFDSWEAFITEWGEADFDYNLVYRWDWIRADASDYAYEIENDPDFEMPGDELKVFFMQQRKANPYSCFIKVTEADEPAVREWLIKRAEHTRLLWEPLLGGAV